MENSLHHAKSCLEAYLGRGNEAISHLMQKNLDQALEVLKWRRAAFCNFRVVDQNLSRQDPSYLLQPGFIELWSKIQNVDQRLEQLINESMGTLKSSLVKTRGAKSKIQKFRSGQISDRGFRGSF